MILWSPTAGIEEGHVRLEHARRAASMDRIAVPVDASLGRAGHATIAKQVVATLEQIDRRGPRHPAAPGATGRAPAAAERPQTRDRARTVEAAPAVGLARASWTALQSSLSMLSPHASRADLVSRSARCPSASSARRQRECVRVRRRRGGHPVRAIATRADDIERRRARWMRVTRSAVPPEA